MLSDLGRRLRRPSRTEPTLKLYCQAAPPAPTPSMHGLALFRRVQRSVEVLADRVHEQVVALRESLQGHED